VQFTPGVYDYYYYLGDNLGNTRVTFDTQSGSATVQQQDDYYPFGLEINRNVNGTKNEYLYNGKELQEELGVYDYQIRQYDPVIGRFTSIDAHAENSRRFSTYSYGVDNSIRYIDPDGMDATSVHVNKYGDVLKNIDDGDNHVYEHDNAKTTADVDKTYSATNTGAGGQNIGELGGTIDVNNIMTNLLQRDGQIAEGLTTSQWVAKVMPHGEWDLKANKSTIFGVAWAYDQDIKGKTGGDNDTFFSYKGFSENVNGVTKFTAADIGNFHAGFTGIAAGVSRQTQYNWAGLGESLKGTGSFSQLWNGVAPYGDRPIDYFWNTTGMNAAQARGLHNTRPSNPLIYYPSLARVCRAGEWAKATRDYETKCLLKRQSLADLPLRENEGPG
jgi:RHS repeat-associated protein